jgi:hypothetical protein
LLWQAGVNGLSALSNNATAVAHGILIHQDAYRVGLALTLISTGLYVALVGLFSRLFRPVNQTLAVLAACFGLVAQAVTAIGSLLALVPLVILGGSAYLSVFSQPQLQALALLCLHLNGQLANIALVFAGPFQILIGYLIFRSTYLPRVLGVLIALAGVGWLLFLWPPLANAVLTELEVLGVLGELPLMLWLLVMGVNAQRWHEQISKQRA